MVLIRESGFAPDDLQLVGIFCRGFLCLRCIRRRWHLVAGRCGSGEAFAPPEPYVCNDDGGAVSRLLSSSPFGPEMFFDAGCLRSQSLTRIRFRHKALFSSCHLLVLGRALSLLFHGVSGSCHFRHYSGLLGGVKEGYMLQALFFDVAKFGQNLIWSYLLEFVVQTGLFSVL